VSVTSGSAFDALFAEVELARDARLAEAANRAWRAMMLAPSLEICAALLRGESVDRLDAEWVARFGLRKAAA
jgi:hypothetical protein